jgi:hypothetical protein
MPVSRFISAMWEPAYEWRPEYIEEPAGAAGPNFPSDVSLRMLHAARYGDFQGALGLVENRGADVWAQDKSGRSMRRIVTSWLNEGARRLSETRHEVLTRLLKIMLLDCPAPKELHNLLSRQQARHPEADPEDARLSLAQLTHYQSLLADGPRLRHRLACYHASMLDCIKEVCPLPNAVHDIILEYQMLATTEDKWATGLGSAINYRLWATPRRSLRLKRQRE